MPDSADYVVALRLLFLGIHDLRDTLTEDQRDQMAWRNLYAAERLILDMGGCVCGEPYSAGVVHRLDGPCHVAEHSDGGEGRG